MPRAPKLTAEQATALVSDYSAGVSITNICAKYDVGRAGVLRYVDRAGGDRRTAPAVTVRTYRALPPSPDYAPTMLDLMTPRHQPTRAPVPAHRPKPAPSTQITHYNPDAELEARVAGDRARALAREARALAEKSAPPKPEDPRITETRNLILARQAEYEKEHGIAPKPPEIKFEVLAPGPQSLAGEVDTTLIHFCEVPHRNAENGIHEDCGARATHRLWIPLQHTDMWCCSACANPMIASGNATDITNKKHEPFEG